MYVEIAIPCHLHKTFTYKVLPSLENRIQPGQRLRVPFRKKERVGIAIALSRRPPSGIEEEKIREIFEILEEKSLFTSKMMDFLQWLSDYYVAPIGEVVASALPSKLFGLKLKTPEPRVEEKSHDVFQEKPPLELTLDQEKALQKIREIKNSGQFKPILLHGVTASGKTEVYLRILKEVLDEGKQGILMVPEIMLTPQLFGRVTASLGIPVALYHSGLTPAKRHEQWEKMRRGELRVVVGTRSALFAPLDQLGIIIVDEEQDPSYKQQEGFLYHARDAGIVRAKLEGALILLGSATPSFETYQNALKGKYEIVSMETRATGTKLPEIHFIDLKKEKFVERSELFSLPLLGALEENLRKGEQTLLLLNRRGFANFLLCKDCGETLGCPNCEVTLTVHRNPLRLQCHYCDYRILPPETCPECGSLKLKPVGKGSQKLEEELKRFFPDAVILRLDRDTAGKRMHRETVLTKMKKGEAHILVGTQMIAKGHDFPLVTLVGVLLAEESLLLPDFRSVERTFQLLIQVAGRSGRKRSGEVYIQTFCPGHPVFQSIFTHDYKAFFATEAAQRKTLKYPPFSRLIQVRIQGSRNECVREAANSLKKFLHVNGNGVTILGPAPAFHARLRSKYRWHLLLKISKAHAMRPLLRKALEKNKYKGVEIFADVDPVSLL